MIKYINILAELQNSAGANQKKEILEEYKDDEVFRKLLYYLLNPRLTYKVSLKAMQRIADDTVYMGGSQGLNLFKLCDYLGNQRAISAQAEEKISHFLSSCPYEEWNFYIDFISKTLRLGVAGKTVNKIIPGLIPEWEVQQAYPIDKYPLKPDVKFSLTEKLNGVRATYYKGQLYARSGNIYTGLDHILTELSVLPPYVVLDGEMILKDRENFSDNEAFRIATGLINSDVLNKSAICYTVFDILTVDEFDKGESVLPYSARRNQLDSLRNSLPCESVKVHPLLYSGKNQSMIDILLDKMVAEDKEGLMVNLETPYKCKRHSGILKVKRFYTMDLPIIQCEEGTGRLKGTLGAFVLDYKGNEIRVGSGFTDEQRVEFWLDKDNLIDVLCEVKYKEISYDKSTQKESLQFPVFVSLRTDKNDISYA